MLSAFFSSAETALITVNRIRMRTLAEDGNKRAATVLRITDNSGKMLSAILIGNNIVNLSASSLATSLAIKIWGSVGAGIATGILTVLILIFGEISPKTLATVNSEKLALTYANVIEVLMKILTPVIFIINKLANRICKLFGVDPNADTQKMTEEELRTIVDVSKESGVIESEEHTMINNVFDFGDAQAKEVMIPRIDMTFAQVDSSYDELIQIFQEDKFTRLPVYEPYNDSIFKVIVNNAFADYKGKMKGFELIIITCTDSETGKISEVLFNFAGFTPYATIPVSIYREIEIKLIGLKYTLTPLAKTLNYVYQWWPIEPK